MIVFLCLCFSYLNPFLKGLLFLVYYHNCSLFLVHKGRLPEWEDGSTFCAVNGHVRCIRLVVADFVPSTPHDAINVQNNGDRGDGSKLKNKYNQSYMACFYFIIIIFLF